MLKRHLVARAAAVPIVSENSWQWWEAWVLERAFELGLDYSPLVGRQESAGLMPPLPATLPNLRVVRNPLPAWLALLLEQSSTGKSGPARQPECSRASKAWPHASLRQAFRQQLGATDEGGSRLWPTW